MKNKRLTIKEAKLVQMTANGATRKDAYIKAYSPPPTTKVSTMKSNTSKVLSRPHVRAALEKALKKHDITLDNSLAPIARALKYENIDNEEKTINIQLQGSDRALKLLNIHQEQGSYHLHLHKHADI